MSINNLHRSGKVVYDVKLDKIDCSLALDYMQKKFTLRFPYINIYFDITGKLQVANVMRAMNPWNPETLPKSIKSESHADINTTVYNTDFFSP